MMNDPDHKDPMLAGTAQPIRPAPSAPSPSEITKDTPFVNANNCMVLNNEFESVLWFWNAVNGTKRDEMVVIMPLGLLVKIREAIDQHIDKMKQAEIIR